MKVEFGAMEETAIPGFKGGEGVTHARMFADGRNPVSYTHLTLPTNSRV